MGSFQAIYSCSSNAGLIQIISGTTIDELIISGIGPYDCSGVYSDLAASAIGDTLLEIKNQTFCSGQIKFSNCFGYISSDYKNIKLSYTAQNGSASPVSCEVVLQRN